MYISGIMFGSKLPMGLWPYDDEDPEFGPLARYEAHLRKQGRGDFWMPSQASENTLLGFWVALPRCVGRVKSGAFLEGNCPIDKIPTRYKESIRSATELWSPFERWVAEAYPHHDPMSPPTLWVTEVEL